MQINQLYIYPIKSLGPTAVQHVTLMYSGVRYDRCFMLLKRNESDGSWENMHVSRIAAMGLFSTEIMLAEDGIDDNDDNDGDGKIIVTYRAPLGHPERGDVRTLKIPLRPEVHDLEEFTVLMHSSPTTAFAMPGRYNVWFSEQFGFTVRLAYLGEYRRPVLGNFMPGEKTLENKGGWLSSITRNIPDFRERKEENRILTFADLAPYLVISQTSLENVSSRLPDGEKMDGTKFRPNIVVSGAETVYEEDYWAELTIRGIRLTLTNNCGRCASINVDYDTGMPGTGEAGSILKNMMKDRRVDPGKKWSPIFRRYGFLNVDSGEGVVMRVRDRVEVTGRNAERTIFGVCPLIVCV